MSGGASDERRSRSSSLFALATATDDRRRRTGVAKLGAAAVQPLRELRLATATLRERRYHAARASMAAGIQGSERVEKREGDFDR
jgi:hypothetical protein